MSRFFLAALLILSAAGVRAQNFQMRIGGGVATHYNNATPIGSFKAGLGVEFELSQSLTFAPSLVFYAKGWKNHNQRVYFRNDDGSQALDKDGNPITGIRNRTTTANYLELPLVFNYYFRLSARHYIVASAGPYVAYGLDARRCGANRFSEALL